MLSSKCWPPMGVLCWGKCKPPMGVLCWGNGVTVGGWGGVLSSKCWPPMCVLWCALLG